MWKKGESDVLIATYAYDGLGRRIRRTVPDLGGGLGGLTGDVPAGTTDFVCSGVQCVEERNPFGGVGEDEDTPLRQYVWGAYVDELIQQREIGAPNVDYYLLSDLLYRSVALTDDGSGGSPTIHEAYDCDAYGRTLIFTDHASEEPWFTDDDVNIHDPASPRDVPLCRFIFTGREYDAETSNAASQLYFYRARYYLPQMGRLASRDPKAYANGMGIYEYARSSPALSMDALGAQATRPAQPPAADASHTPWAADPEWAALLQSPLGAGDVVWESIRQGRAAYPLRCLASTEIYHLRGKVKGSFTTFGKGTGPYRHTVISFGDAIPSGPGADFGPTAPYQDNIVAHCWWSCPGTSSGRTGTILLQLREDLDVKHQLLKHMSKERHLTYAENKIDCCHATDKQIENCIKEFSKGWETKKFGILFGPNCMDFAEQAEAACCLEPGPRGPLRWPRLGQSDEHARAEQPASQGARP